MAAGNRGTVVRREGWDRKTSKVTRGGKNFMERPIQHLYPLELSCDIGNYQETEATAELNANASELRSRIDAVVAARIRNQQIGEVMMNN